MLQDPEKIKTIEELEHGFNEVFLLKDEGIVRMCMATVIANRMEGDPVWLLLVAPSSGGKTEMINALSGLSFVWPISDLTVNTFASGQKKIGKETSLLLKINNGVMTFKDFTSILSKNQDARKEIMGQLREIFDGHYTKRTGTGDDIEWTGKVGAIAGSTEAIYKHLEDLSAMGDRFVMYNIDQPDRMEVARRALKNSHDLHEKREWLKRASKCYIEHVLETLDTIGEEMIISDEYREELLRVSDFASKVRSAVMYDFKTGQVDFVPSAEMPMRIAQQLYTIAGAFMAMRKSNPSVTKESVVELSDFEMRLLYKIAFDSIPKIRRLAIYNLAKYKGGLTTAGLAVTLGLPTQSVGKYLSQVNALGICDRIKKGGSQGDQWNIKEEYRDIMVKMERIDIVDGPLISNAVDDQDEAWEEWEQHKRAQETDSLEIKNPGDGKLELF